MVSLSRKFGHGMREHFLFDEKWINMNHGSFGTYPRSVADAKERYTRMIESAPDKFLRYDYVPLLNRSRKQLADLLQVPVDECVLIENASTALDLIFRNFSYQERHVILYFDTIYAAVEKTLLSVQEMWPQLCLRKVGYGCSKSYKLPASYDEICDIFAESIINLQREGYVVKVAVFDTIVSLPGVRLPFERLTEICRNFGVLSVVDGAHGIGQIQLNLAELDADFFVSNCHKWLYTPRGCAVFHVPKRNQHLIRTSLPTSWVFESKTKTELQQVSPQDGPSRFVKQFQFAATADNTPSYCVAAAIEFREQVCAGEEAIQYYTTDVAQRGAEVIAKKLGTQVMGHPEVETQNSHASEFNPTSSSFTGLRDCSMANVLLPVRIKTSSQLDHGSIASGNGINPSDVSYVTAWMQKILVTDHNTSVSIYSYHGQIWVRVCGQIYLELSDFEWFADCLQDVCKRVNAGEPFVERITMDYETVQNSPV